MRTTIYTLFAVLVMLGTSSQKAESQYSNMFGEDQHKCVAAIGKVHAYAPIDLRGVNKNPVNNVDRIVAPLEGSGACVHMITTRGWQWVPIDEGTKLRWKILPDGTRVPFADDRCGNDINGIAYPSSPEFAGLRGPAGRDGKDGRDGIDGKDGRDGIDGKDATFDIWPCDNSRLWRAGCWTVAAIGTALVVKNNWPHDDDNEPEHKAPGVATDSVCVTTVYPPICTKKSLGLAPVRGVALQSDGKGGRLTISVGRF